MLPRRCVALSLATLGAAACGPEPFEVPPVVWSGEHLDYAPQAHADPVCAGTPSYMDRYVELAAAELDVELGRVVFIHGSYEDPPFCHALGCEESGIVYSRRAPHEHELVHAVRSFAGNPHKFFEEGTAEMFGGDDVLNPNRVPAEGDLREGIEAGVVGVPFPDPWYPRAGTFSAYLHRYHGPEVTRALLLETRQASTAEETIAVLEAATSMPFDELALDYEWQEPFCALPQWYRYPLYPCDAPEALRARCDGPVAVPIEESLACEDSTVLGPREEQIFKYVAFDVPIDGPYRLRGEPREGDEDAWIELKQCLLGCSSDHIGLPYEGLDHLVYLHAGRHTLRLTRWANSEAPTSMSVTISGEDCG